MMRNDALARPISNSIVADDALTPVLHISGVVKLLTRL